MVQSSSLFSSKSNIVQGEPTFFLKFDDKPADSKETTDNYLNNNSVISVDRIRAENDFAKAKELGYNVEDKTESEKGKVESR